MRGLLPLVTSDPLACVSSQDFVAKRASRVLTAQPSSAEDVRAIGMALFKSVRDHMHTFRNPDPVYQRPKLDDLTVGCAFLHIRSAVLCSAPAEFCSLRCMRLVRPPCVRLWQQACPAAVDNVSPPCFLRARCTFLCRVALITCGAKPVPAEMIGTAVDNNLPRRADDSDFAQAVAAAGHAPAAVQDAEDEEVEEDDPNEAPPGAPRAKRLVNLGNGFEGRARYMSFPEYM